MKSFTIPANDLKTFLNKLIKKKYLVGFSYNIKNPILNKVRNKKELRCVVQSTVKRSVSILKVNNYWAVNKNYYFFHFKFTSEDFTDSSQVEIIPIVGNSKFVYEEN